MIAVRVNGVQVIAVRVNGTSVTGVYLCPVIGWLPILHYSLLCICTIRNRLQTPRTLNVTTRGPDVFVRYKALLGLQCPPPMDGENCVAMLKKLCLVKKGEYQVGVTKVRKKICQY